MKAKLAKMKGAFAAAKADPRATQANAGYTNSPDGNYIADLTGWDIGESANSQRMQTTWMWTIMEGEHAGQTSRDYDGMVDTDSFTFLLNKLHRYGVNIQNVTLDNLPEKLETLVAMRPRAKMRLKTNINKNTGQSFQNIYINEILGYMNNTPDDQKAADEENAPNEFEGEGVIPPTADDDDEAVSASAAPATATKPKQNIGLMDRVSFEMDGVTKSGIVKKIDDDEAVVLSSGMKLTLDIGDLTLLAAAGA